ncbi:Ca2+-dependent phosphoinositide-specific phospholipase C [Polyangium sorediatum]|uniref:Ca2+-dependent phosphoinositide-specific phospholipase C n=1 Tax=Polyangium sorediatum TaxID=889274 RepID=A0ABT6P2G3_9BACT|nr:Ca2+-dependent phosphoinositide-specific phospholipase C [Polyangium sorediatum]MDI1434552.1 Ca2+-dependent phosphoinositide-specific phospholipase C [Polyangium sorediatum]
MHSRLSLALSLLSLAFSLSACGGTEDQDGGAPTKPSFTYPLDDVLRLHHVQTKATHNSFHVANPDLSGPEYAVDHAPLDVQLAEQGVRSVELDLRYDEALGDYKVAHVPFLDEGSTCATFRECLGVMKRWSDAHPAHLPFTILLDLKDLAPSADTIEASFGTLHEVILGVWPQKRIVTPDEVQGDHATLGEAVKTEGWPTLGKLRGRVIFTMYNLTDGFGIAYARGGTSLAGRLAFTRTVPTDPHAAWTLYDDPIVTKVLIDEAAAANMLIRTRAEIDLDAALAGNTSLRDAALASAAHFITTDYPAPIDSSTYHVDIKGGTPARCNPVTAPAECTSEAIEDPAFMKP